MTVHTITIDPQHAHSNALGEPMSFARSDALDLVASYDFAADPAPIIIGTPKMDDPAFGWVSGLSIAAGKIVATIENLSSKLAEAIREGAFKGVSMDAYPPTHPHNPKPGRWYLKHISYRDGPSIESIRGIATQPHRSGVGGTVRFDSEFIPAGGAQASFACPSGYQTDPGQHALYARARAISAANPGLGIVEAALRARNLPECSFTELGEAVVTKAALIPPEIEMPSGYSMDSRALKLYRDARALMAEDQSLDVVKAAMKARQ